MCARSVRTSVRSVNCAHPQLRNAYDMSRIEARRDARLWEANPFSGDGHHEEHVFCCPFVVVLAESISEV